jgi:hypothetical protein
MSKPGLVTRVHGKDHEEVDVAFGTETMTAKNMLKNIKVGDYVILNEDLVIEILHANDHRLKDLR